MIEIWYFQNVFKENKARKREGQQLRNINKQYENIYIISMQEVKYNHNFFNAYVSNYE